QQLAMALGRNRCSRLWPALGTQAEDLAEAVKHIMKFSFMVGVQEQHRVDFSFDQFAGNLEILVDGQQLIKDFRMLSLKLTRRYEFVVGVQEQHSVAIEKKRKLFLAGFQPQQYRIFIDGRLVQTYEG